ncbi:hypothetical protein D3C74_288890 [compost metagenome]
MIQFMAGIIQRVMRRVVENKQIRTRIETLQHRLEQQAEIRQIDQLVRQHEEFRQRQLALPQDAER